MITLTDAQRDTLNTMLAEWTCVDGAEGVYDALWKRTRVRGEFNMTQDECALVMKAFGARSLEFWRRGVALMNSIEEGAKG